MGGRNRARCSGVPYWIRVGPRRPSPRTLTRPGAWARTYSSLKMTWWAMEAPRPPCSTGHPMPVHPSGGQHPLPLQPGLESEGLVTRTTPSAQRRELADHMVRQPGADLLAEGLVLGSVSEVHGGWDSRIVDRADGSCPGSCRADRGRRADPTRSDATLANPFRPSSGNRTTRLPGNRAARLGVPYTGRSGAGPRAGGFPRAASATCTIRPEDEGWERPRRAGAGHPAGKERQP